MTIQGESGRNRKITLHWDCLGLVLCALCLFAVNMRNIGLLNGPFMFNDELGYLGNAAAVAGKDWHEVMQRCAWYGFGWSLIIAPLFALFSSMPVIYRCIITLNACLVVGAFLLQREILKRLFTDLRSSILTLISAVACLYPSVLVNSSIAWCETWLFFLFTCLTYLISGIVKKRKLYYFIIFGFLLDYLYVSHNRMIGVVIAGFLVMIVLCFTHKARLKDALVFSAAFAISFLVFDTLKAYIVSLNWRLGLPSGNDMNAGVSVLKSLFNPTVMLNFTYSLISKVFYFSVASCGLVPLGIVLCVNKVLKAVKERKVASAAVELWIILSFLGMFLITSLMMGASQDLSVYRLDHVFYGRYYEPTCVVLVAYGFISASYLQRVKQKRYMTIISICSLAVLFVSGIAYLAMGKMNDSSFIEPNASGISAYLESFNMSPLFSFFTALVALTAFLFIVTFLSSQRRLLFAGAFAIFALITVTNTLSAEDSIVVSQTVLEKNIPFIHEIQDYDIGDKPIYILGLNGSNMASYFQCMLPEKTFKYGKNLSGEWYSFDNIAESEYYALMPTSLYYHYGFNCYMETACHSSDYIVAYVDRNVLVANRELKVPLDMLYLHDCSTMQDSILTVESETDTLAFYGPYIAMDNGNYLMNISMQIDSEEIYDNYGVVQIYSNSRREFFAQQTLSSEMVNSGIISVEVPFAIYGDVNDVEIYLRTRKGVTYYLYDITIARDYIYTYDFCDAAASFEVSGFSHAEPKGRWIIDEEATVDCYIPDSDYELIIDLGYSIPLDKLGLDEYTVLVYMNNIYIGEITWAMAQTTDLYSFSITDELVNSGDNTITIVSDEMWLPSDYGSSDTRQLSICIERIVFEPVEAEAVSENPKEITISFDLNDFYTAVGSKQDGLIISDGSKGCLMFGPYSYLKKGKYVLQVEGEIISGTLSDDSMADVYDHVKKKQVVQVKKLNQFVDGNSYHQTLEFVLTKDVEEIEFRIYINNGVIMKINQVQLVKDYWPGS